MPTPIRGVYTNIKTTQMRGFPTLCEFTQEISIDFTNVGSKTEPITNFSITYAGIDGFTSQGQTFTTNSGSKMSITYNDPWRSSAYFYDSANNVVAQLDNWYTNGQAGKSYVSFCTARCNGQNVVLICIISVYNSNVEFIRSSEEFNNAFLSDAGPDIDYNWKSVRSLNLASPNDLLPFTDPNAQSGVYTMLLSFIPDEYLNDGEPVSSGTNFVMKNPSLVDFLNKYNTSTFEYKNIYLKTKKYAKLGIRDAVSHKTFSFTFLSAIGGLTPQITYYTKSINVVPSVDGIPYLGFIVDEENTAAKLNIIFVKSSYDTSTGLTSKTVDYNTISMSDSEMNQLYAWLNGSYGYEDDSEDEEENIPQGGDENDPVVNEPLNRPTLPTKGAVGSGFIKIYEVSDTELQDICEFMWDDSLLTNLGRLFSDPREIIVGLMVFPIKPKSEDITTNSPIYAGNLDSGVTGSLIKKEYRTKYAGEVRVNVGNNDFMSFAPYRRIKINIPYCGEHELDPSAVFGATLKLYYHLSYFNGNCIAELTRTFDGGEEEPFAFFGGQIGYSIPLSSEDFTRQLSSYIAAGVTVGTALCTYGASSAIAGVASAERSTAMATAAGMHLAGAGIGVGSNIASGALAPKVSYNSGGGASSGFLSSQQPYLIIDVPITAYDGSQRSYIGNISRSVKKLGDCNGFTKCFEAHIEGVHATESELNEIMDWLTKGVIIHPSGGSNTPSDVPSVTGNTVINFMKLSSEVNVIGKIWTNVTPIEGKLIYDQSISEPKILVNSSALEYNYCYIGLFKRFYFVKDIIARNSDLIEIQLKSDPLESFEDEIKLCYASVDRQSQKGNAFIEDSYKWTQINNDVCIKPFKENGVDFDFAHTDDTYILTIAGI